MLVRVLEIPPPSGNFHHQGGEPQTFVEVDWFRDDEGFMETDEGRARAEEMVRGKVYFDGRKAYLVLHPRRPFTIGYDPDRMPR